jgi:hypothetical protein
MPAPARTHITLRAAIARLAKFYGPPPRPPATDPFERVIWENCAYLVDDAELRRTVQRSPVEAKKLLRRFPGIGEPSADAAPRCDACPLASACVWCLTHA